MEAFPLHVEVNQRTLSAWKPLQCGTTVLAITPPLDQDYWVMRVPVSAQQAIVCFPKFFTIGIGFQREEDWNTNLPYTCPAEEIFQHIAHNKGDDAIPDEQCVNAIRLLQETITAYLHQQEDEESSLA